MTSRLSVFSRPPASHAFLFLVNMFTSTERDASCILGNPPPTDAPSSTRSPTPRADVPPCTAFAPPPSAPSSAETTTATSATHPPEGQTCPNAPPILRRRPPPRTTCYLFRGPRPPLPSIPPAPSSVDHRTAPAPEFKRGPERKKTFLKDVPREQLETLHPIIVGGLLMYGWTWAHVPPWDGAGAVAAGEAMDVAAGEGGGEGGEVAHVDSP